MPSLREVCSMRFAIVARQLPQREGTAPGRVLRAACEGLLDEGHDVALWCWSPAPPTEDLPSWCEWRPLPFEPAWRTRLRALRSPRADVVRGGWHADGADTVALADDIPSFAAVAGAPQSAVTFHYATAADAAALHRRSLRDLQDRRAERRAAAEAGVVLTYSQRAAAGANGRARFIPMPFAVPAAPVEPVEEPVAALLADWSWAPNRAALEALLRAWPAVRDRVAGARLLLG